MPDSKGFARYLPLLLILLLAFLLLEASKKGDFTVFIDAAKHLNAHQEIYSVWLDNGAAKYYYSPLFALILIPFTYIPLIITELLWLCANVFFLYRLCRIIYSWLDFSLFTKKENVIILLTVFFLSFRFLLANFENVQMTVFLLWAMFESLELFEKEKNIAGAVLLALAINIKIMPIAMIPYLLVRKKIIQVVLVCIAYVFFLFLPAIFLGMHYNNELIYKWFEAIFPSGVKHDFYVSYGTQDIEVWVSSLLMKTGGDFPFRRNILNLEPATVNWIINIVRVILIFATFYFTGVKLFRKAKSKLSKLWELSYITLIIPLVFPHQQKYEYFLTFPAVVYISYFIVYQHHNRFASVSYFKWKTIVALLCMVFVLNTLTSDLFIGMHFSQITQHYKVITYGTILLAIALVMCKPDHIEACYNNME